MEKIYTIILVDDEDDVRGRISNTIALKDEFKVIGTAQNGYDALDLIELHQPDIVITDIKMPFIDGIELTNTIKRNYPTIKVGIISGFDEFEYARRAIDLGVVSYIMKPITKTVVFEFLNKVKKILDSEYKEKYNIDLIKQTHKESISIVVENIFRGLLLNSNIQSSDLEKLTLYSIKTNDKFLIASILISNEAVDSIKVEKIKVAVKRLSEDILISRYVVYSLFFANTITFIIKENNKNFKRDIDVSLYEIIKSVEKILEIPIFIGVSNIYDDFKLLAVAYQESETALSYNKFLDVGHIIHYDELEDKKTIKLTLSDSDIKRLEYSLRFSSIEDIADVVNEIKNKIKYDSDYFHDQKNLVINLSSIIIRYANSTGVDLKQIEENLFEKLLKINDINEIFDYVIDISNKIRNSQIARKISKTEKLLENVINYLEVNYNDPNISLESVCDEMDVSVSYLSMLFKKHKKTTFIKYLISLRMTKAKDLLKVTNHKIITIAEMVGYNEVYYFSHSFKKYTGLSPKEYRNELV